jgi:predicted Zn-dependent protease
MTRAPEPAPEDRQKASVLAPVVVLALFAVLVPVQLTPPGQGASAGECLTAGAAHSTRQHADLSLLERCTALYPGDVALLAELGTASEKVDPLGAETTYRRALALDPDYADLRLRLARLLLRRGAPADAVREAEEALRVQPNREVLLELLAEARLAAAGSPR